MKDTKHIRQDFHSVTLVMPQSGTLARWGCPGGVKFFFLTWSCGISSVSHSLKKGQGAGQKKGTFDA